MRACNVVFSALILSLGVFLAGCGKSNSASDASVVQSGKLSWVSSSNSIYVLDAKGTPYYFSAKTGCMFDKNNNNGPANFCLTPSTSQSSGYMLSGSTGCANPASNTACNIANFAVVLTNNPSGAGCIAALGTGGSSPTAIAGSIAVVDADGSFTIGGGTLPRRTKPTGMEPFPSAAATTSTREPTPAPTTRPVAGRLRMDRASCNPRHRQREAAA